MRSFVQCRLQRGSTETVTFLEDQDLRPGLIVVIGNYTDNIKKAWKIVEVWRETPLSSRMAYLAQERENQRRMYREGWIEY
jgi:hypothetical protein